MGAGAGDLDLVFCFVSNYHLTLQPNCPVAAKVCSEIRGWTERRVGLCLDNQPTDTHHPSELRYGVQLINSMAPVDVILF